MRFAVNVSEAANIDDVAWRIQRRGVKVLRVFRSFRVIECEGETSAIDGMAGVKVRPEGTFYAH